MCQINWIAPDQFDWLTDWLIDEGTVIENILPNKQSFTSAAEAGTELRIMQWNLTGLRGATWAEELINVWGPAGVICTFCLRSRLTYQSSHCTKLRANVLFNGTSPGHKTQRRCNDENERRCRFAPAPLCTTCTHFDCHTWSIHSERAMWFCRRVPARSLLSCHGLVHDQPVLATVSSTTVWWNYKERQSQWPLCPVPSLRQSSAATL